MRMRPSAAAGDVEEGIDQDMPSSGFDEGCRSLILTEYQNRLKYQRMHRDNVLLHRAQTLKSLQDDHDEDSRLHDGGHAGSSSLTLQDNVLAVGGN